MLSKKKSDLRALLYLPFLSCFYGIIGIDTAPSDQFPESLDTITSYEEELSDYQPVWNSEHERLTMTMTKFITAYKYINDDILLHEMDFGSFHREGKTNLCIGMAQNIWYKIHKNIK